MLSRTLPPGSSGDSFGGSVLQMGKLRPSEGGAGTCLKSAAEPELEPGALGCALLPARPPRPRWGPLLCNQSWVLFDPSLRWFLQKRTSFPSLSGGSCCGSRLTTSWQGQRNTGEPDSSQFYLNNTATVNAY